jgi:hypothetical protein
MKKIRNTTQNFRASVCCAITCKTVGVWYLLNEAMKDQGGVKTLCHPLLLNLLLIPNYSPALHIHNI